MSRSRSATSPGSASAVAFDVFNAPLDGISLVEASAGTGKTWNICGLYLRLLLEHGLQAREILVVTFTNAATAELRERVRARVVDMLAYVNGGSLGEPDDFVVTMTRTLEMRGVTRAEMQVRLDLALQSFDEAAIFTIHGWCQRALAQTQFTAGLPFEVEVQPDDTELRLAVVHDFWRRNVAGDGCPAPVAAWLETRRVTPESLEKLLRRHLAKPLADVRWPQAIDESPDVDVDGLNDVFESARATWHAERDAIIDAVKSGRMKPNVAMQAATEWDAWFGHDALAYIKWKDSKLPRFSTSWLTAKNGAAARHAFFDQADALIAGRKATEVKLERARLWLVRTLFAEAGPALRKRKREARLASYDDLLQNLYAALTDSDGTARADALRRRFPAALIDEFQDTDPVQFAIFDAIYGAGDASLFLVGDPKQAIYAFRNADLHTYLQAARDVKTTSTLTENQRSTPGLVAAVNALFGGNGRAFMLDRLDYHEVRVGARTRTILHDRSGTNADLCIWRLPRWGDGTPLDRRTALDASASATAAEISRLLRASAAGHITLDGVPLAPDDIAVLVRSHRQGDDIKQALAALGIGSVELSQATVFKSPDAEDVERVLAAILAPADDGLLRAALATELFGLDATAIAVLGDDELALMSHVRRFLAYRESWLESGIGVMYRRLLANEGVAARMLARADGERRLTNLLHLGELLHKAAETHRAPDALLRWLDAQRRDDAGDDVAQLRLESDRNLVRIATIHKVKGLEFPIVFCPFLWDAFLRARNTIEGREYHDDEGRAVVDLRSDDEVGDAELDAIKDRIRLEASAESVRLFYVALTRASHRCYLVAGCYARMYKSGPSPKETTCGLLNWLVAGEGMTAEQWLDGKCTVTDIDDAWERLGTTLAPDVACYPLSMEAGEPVALDRPPAERLFAARPPKRIASPWRIGSFSGLHDGAVSEIAASDHDAWGAGIATQTGANRAIAAASTLDGVAGDDILRFPRGVGAGDCLHAVLERVDFTESAGWDDAIVRALRRHPVSLPGTSAPASQPLLRRMVLRMIDDVVHTGLPDAIRLDAIPNDKRLVELEFSLPADRLDAGALNDALKASGYAVDRLTFGQLDGYLRGFIDLVFEHRNRYYVLDWKSNHLGYAPADYAPDALAAAMAAHGYHLQALLYSIALARYLAQRVRGYRHDAHFGGVLYLFVRGVRPGWRNADGTATGVHFHRPSAATLARLDALLGAASRKTAS